MSTVHEESRRMEQMRDSSIKAAETLERLEARLMKQGTPRSVAMAVMPRLLAARRREDAALAERGMVRADPVSIDAKLVAIGVEMAAIFVKAGVRRFEDYAKEMRAAMPDIWQRLQPYLLSFWIGATIFVEGIEDITPSQARAIIAGIDKASGDKCGRST